MSPSHPQPLPLRLPGHPPTSSNACSPSANGSSLGPFSDLSGRLGSSVNWQNRAVRGHDSSQVCPVGGPREGLWPVFFLPGSSGGRVGSETSGHDLAQKRSCGQAGPGRRAGLPQATQPCQAPSRPDSWVTSPRGAASPSGLSVQKVCVSRGPPTLTARES